MQTRSLKLIATFIICVFTLGACGQNLYTQGKKLVASGEYAGAADKFSEDLLLNPDHEKSWRELGVAEYKLGRFLESLSNLDRARRLKADPRTELYRGMALEKLSRWNEAEAAYESALSLNPPASLVERIRSRQERVSRRDVVSKALAAEGSIDVASIPLNTVAVYDFDGSKLSPELAPIALGLAEFTALDLAKVEALTVVERVKLSILLDEMRLAESGVVDPATAPRVGRLLGSRRVVAGWVESPETEQIRIGGVIVNTVDNTEALPQSEEETLQKLFKLQKAFVYHVLDELGVVPSKEEREKIDLIPTDSLSAFMEYCRGLQSLRTGSFAEAETRFESASSIDNGFSEASDQLSSTTEIVEDLNFENYVQNLTAPVLSDPGALLGDITRSTGGVPGGGDGDPESSGDGANLTPQIPPGSARVKGNPDAN
ncbi:MAG: hypothetical protein ACE5GA_04860 [Candidatus Zixiibacteriota bacterium]